MPVHLDNARTTKLERVLEPGSRIAKPEERRWIVLF
jgi:hypothetical protein